MDRLSSQDSCGEGRIGMFMTQSALADQNKGAALFCLCLLILNQSSRSAALLTILLSHHPAATSSGNRSLFQCPFACIYSAHTQPKLPSFRITSTRHSKKCRSFAVLTHTAKASSTSTRKALCENRVGQPSGSTSHS
jgi:hypothetical protein